MKRTGLYPGTFDPATLGHLDIIRRSENYERKLRLLNVANREPSMESSDGLDDLEAALQVLAPLNRLVVVLRYLEGMPVKEIAEAPDRSPKAVEALLARSRRALRAAIEEETDAIR